MIAALADWDALRTVVWASLAAGIGATAAYGFAILGAARAMELGREGRIGEAVLFGVVGVAGLLAVIASIGFGIAVLNE